MAIGHLFDAQRWQARFVELRADLFDGERREKGAIELVLEQLRFAAGVLVDERAGVAGRSGSDEVAEEYHRARLGEPADLTPQRQWVRQVVQKAVGEDH